MDDNLSERQQVEQLRDLVKQNAPWAVGGILIGVLGLLGWQQWHSWLDRQAFTASQKYQATLEALSRNDGDGAVRLTKELRDDYSRTPYADLAALALARFDVEAAKLPDAARYLAEVAQKAQDPELKTVARLRLARVERAEGKPDQALATLAQSPPGAAAAAFADVRGDLLLDKGDKAAAIAAWREALAAKTPGIVNSELIELKLAALGAEPAAAATPVPVTGGQP